MERFVAAIIVGGLIILVAMSTLKNGVELFQDFNEIKSPIGKVAALIIFVLGLAGLVWFLKNYS